MEESKWEVIGIKNCTKKGEESLHICANNTDGTEFSLYVELKKIVEIGKPLNTVYNYTRLGKLTLTGYEPNIEGIRSHGVYPSRLISTTDGNFIVLIKRQEEEW